MTGIFEYRVWQNSLLKKGKISYVWKLPRNWQKNSFWTIDRAWKLRAENWYLEVLKDLWVPEGFGYQYKKNQKLLEIGKIEIWLELAKFHRWISMKYCLGGSNTKKLSECRVWGWQKVSQTEKLAKYHPWISMKYFA